MALDTFHECFGDLVDPVRTMPVTRLSRSSSSRCWRRCAVRPRAATWRCRAVEGGLASFDPDAGARHSEPRHVQPRVPAARSQGVRGGVRAVHAGLRGCGEAGQDQGRRRGGRQVAAARLRGGREPYAQDDGEPVGGADPHDAGQRAGGGQRRDPGGAGRTRTGGVEGLHRHRRRAALPCRHG